jgi:hypothetical protein
MSHRKSVSTGRSAGIRYEDHINQILKKKGFQPSGVSSAGPTDEPDGWFLSRGSAYPLEIKKDLGADFAQTELRWSQDRGFYFSSKTKNPEFVPILESERFLDEINEKWRSIPRKFTRASPTQQDRFWDLDHFHEIHREVDAAKLVEKFYARKTPPINYIQIGKKGFFYMTADVAGLNVPRLCSKGILRARIKTRDFKKNDYGFLVAIKLKKATCSTYDIEEKDGRVFPFSEARNKQYSKKPRLSDLPSFLDRERSK